MLSRSVLSRDRALRFERTIEGSSKWASRAASPGFTLLELLMVIAVIAILTAVMLPWSDSTSNEMVDAAARAVATDLAYARSLAVTNNSKYAVAFDTSQNSYTLRHTGADSALNVLPDSVFRNSNDPPDQHIVRLDELPGIGEPVKLSGLFRVSGSVEPLIAVEFGPLGETTQTGYAALILTLGSGLGRRSSLVLINPVTGLATIHSGGRDLPSDIPSSGAQTLLDEL